MSGAAASIRPLAGVAFGDVYDAFRDAFSDYPTAAGTLTEQGLLGRAIKNGWDADASAGAFDGGRLVGVTLVGLDEFGGGPAAYDIATGIRPTHRGRGLAGKMMEFLVPRLRARGATRFYLEVLRENAAAIRAYEKTGFTVRRRFECLRLEPQDRVARGSPGVRVEAADRGVLALARDWLDWEPSWENTLAAMARLPDDPLVLAGAVDGVLCGVLAWHAPSGWIHTLAVHPDARRRGVASSLVDELVRRHPDARGFKLNNIPDRETDMLAFAGAAGFRFYAGQYEMVRPLER